ncbi:pseudouridine synthase [Ceratobasidium sp. AG-I]|nr:pseudouridine synthase [Ceratobasidium sp. AG-I]
MSGYGPSKCSLKLKPLQNALKRNHVIYMDRSLIVLNKPAGLVAQGGRHLNHENTLDHLLDDLTTSIPLDVKPLPVHRLDKPTTGALILARNQRTARSLSAQLSRTQPKSSIEKTYLALVHRLLQPGGSGEIRQRLYITDGRVAVDKSSLGRQRTQAEERDSLTTWQCLASSARSPVSLVQFGLHTGVKHQLRVVAASVLRAPILGDPIYGSDHTVRLANEETNHGLALHSARVKITRYLRKAFNGHREYQLAVTAPLPANFMARCRHLDIAVDPAWTTEPAKIEINDTSIPFDYAEVNEEIVLEVMKGRSSSAVATVVNESNSL